MLCVLWSVCADAMWEVARPATSAVATAANFSLLEIIDGLLLGCPPEFSKS
jgi:hypothetical protein